MAKAKARRAGKTTIGIVGCGNISGTYFTNIREMFNILEITACADIIPERAKAKSKEFPGVRALSTNEIYTDKNIDVILNLTPPLAHAEVSMRAAQIRQVCLQRETACGRPRRRGRFCQTRRFEEAARRLRAGYVSRSGAPDLPQTHRTMAG